MYQNQRYRTRGVAYDLPPILQAVLWQLVDEMKVSEKDYLQVFKLSGNGNEQVILHEQEQPPYKKTHRLTLVGTPFFVGKIYVIDDGEHTTMLKASEY